MAEHQAHDIPLRSEGGAYTEQPQAEALILPSLVWQAIYGARPGFVALFSGARPRPGAKLERVRETYFAWPREIPSALAWVAGEVGEERELYQCSHLTTRWRRRKEDAAPLASLYVDLDSGQLPPTIPPPTVIIQSSPGRLQCYWRLTTPVPPAEGEASNRRLAAATGADPSGWDLSQLLRIPGTRNHKYPESPEVTVVALTALAYNLQELLAALPPEPRDRSRLTSSGSPRPRLTIETHPNVLPANLTAAAQRIYSGELVRHTPDGRVDRSVGLVQIARVLAGAGVPPEEIPGILAERDETLGWRKYSDRADAQRQYQRIVGFVLRAPRR